MPLPQYPSYHFKCHDNPSKYVGRVNNFAMVNIFSIHRIHSYTKRKELISQSLFSEWWGQLKCLVSYCNEFETTQKL